MRLDPDEFRARPLRVHALLHDVPLEDAWAVPLSGGGADRTVQDVRVVMLGGRATAPAMVRGLFGLRRRIGALFGWDDQRPAWNAESYADRLSPPDRAQSLVAPGTPDGSFHLLYRFEDEQLGELRNATVHAFASLSIRQAPGGYLAYFGGLREARASVHHVVHGRHRHRSAARWSIRPSFEKCRGRGPNAMVERAVSRVGGQDSGRHRPLSA
jgi:hypothetical protein